MVLAQLSIGSFLLTSILSAKEIRLSFFTFMSLFCTLCLTAVLIFSKLSLQYAWGEVRWLGITILGGMISFGCFRLEKLVWGRILLLVSGLLGLFFGVFPLVERTLNASGLETTASGFFIAGAIAGAFLLGATHGGMVLGHWYLIMRRLSFIYLERFSKILLIAIGVRLLIFLLTLLLLEKFDPLVTGKLIEPLWSIGGNLMFFAMRILWGLLLPGILAFLVFRCVQLKANQAATGMLYVIEVSLFFGELFAAYLMI